MVNPLKPPSRILAIANQKGGVGKTTTAVNLGMALVATGRRVLIADLDPQGNASTGLAVPRQERATGSYDVLIGRTSVAAAIRETEIPGLAILPSLMDLSGAEIELIDLPRREFRLRDAIVGHETGFDYVLIDCPPALGLLTLNALVAAHGVLVPLQAEFLALEGLSHLLSTIGRVQRNLNSDLELQGVVLTMVDKRNNLSRLVESDVRAHLGDTVYETVIPRNVRVSEAPSHGKPVLLYDLRCAGSRAYLDLAREFLAREAAATPATTANPEMKEAISA
jgi:chromosome partitioning protein